MIIVHRSLLKRYMSLVRKEEGIDYLGRLRRIEMFEGQGSGVKFTKEEMDELILISKEKEE